MIKPLPVFLREIDDAVWTAYSSATDYPDGWIVEPHSHNKDQLIHAIEGVMVVYTDQCQWSVPPNRGIWMPSGQVHSIRCAGPLKMRSVFIQAGLASGLPAATTILSVSPLLSELIKTSVGMALSQYDNSRESRIMNLILDEISLLPEVPLHLPRPADARIRKICAALMARPDDGSTLRDWSLELGIDERTIQRLFQKETGLTFGQWRQQFRLLLALEMIARGDKIIDVAAQLGYDSPSAFAVMFKKQFGKTPSNFFKDPGNGK
ncbi:AraC family transcriptional regulator [Stutzerimonas sp. NM35]|uniref:AraC family transcriptional regulator n=1 Tax=Stutzerimonas stutzeri TaxID=316 RepID=UPI0015E34954|nr:helix-turn-helix transcriptional regulator [Stutzerimonas stutzeri]MBA1262749.1 AraC family transcriptional regulator [Stutzerimonas stutzeri]